VAGTFEGAVRVSSRLVVMRLTQPLVGRYPKLFYPIARWTAWLTFRMREGKRRALIANMTPFFPDDAEAARRAALGSAKNIAQYYVDLCRIPYLDLETFEREHLVIRNEERLRALDEPGPIVVVSAHTGNAELAIQALTVRGRPFVALVEAQPSREWSRYLLKLRSSAGGAFFEADFGGVRACLEALKHGGLAGFMGDRDIQQAGVCTQFAGRCVRFPTGPWEIALRTNALVLPIFSNRIASDRFEVFVEEPFRVGRDCAEGEAVRAAIGRFAELAEAHLRRDPSQWAFTEDYFRVHACG
jgi:lauroyl/myristoyl acyltransferase